jgi:GntR family transcriptional regulator, rspAB operon transcriptional repressor
MNLTSVKRPRASDAVFNVLRESILDRTFHPGQRLEVKLLSDKLEVSQTPIKEAIARLIAEGLIEQRPRSGTYVARLSTEDIEDTLAVRRALECLAAEAVFDNITDDDLIQLEELVVLLERPMNSERERRQHERKNNEFHLRIVELSRNRKLIDIYNNLNAHIKMARVHTTSVISRKRALEERQEHRRILAALMARDPSALALALNDHISRAAALLVSDLKKTENDEEIA